MFLHFADFVDGVAGSVVDSVIVQAENLVIETVAFQLNVDGDAMIVGDIA